MRVGLISGHGAGDSGAVGCGYHEADLTIEVVKALDKKLKAMGVDTKIYPYDRNAYKDCKNYGGLKVNFSDCDYVLEVHFNACVNDPEGNNHVTGSEIWVTSREESVNVENCILSNMERLGFTNRGVKVTNFWVINDVKSQGVSSALIETCFIDDKDDMDLFMSKRDEVIAAIANGICEGFGYEAADTAEPEPEGTSYLVKIRPAKLEGGYLNIRSGAGMDHKVVGKIDTDMTVTIVEECNGWGRLKSGAGWISLDCTDRV